MVAEGKGKERERFKDINQGKVSSFSTTAEYYVSFYDPKGYPSPKTNLPRIQMPVLWVAGKDDRNTRFYRIKKNHELIPNGRYIEVDGTHKSVVGNSAFNIADWIDSLE